MAGRIRTVKPDFFVDEQIAELKPLTRIAFVGLWTQADKAGRLEDRPKRLKTVLLPYDDVDMDEILAELARGRFIIRYQVDGRRLIQVRTFTDHQRPHHTEKASVLPNPEALHCDDDEHGYEDPPESHGKPTVISPLEHGEAPVLKGRERKGRKEDMGDSPSPASPASESSAGNPAPTEDRLAKEFRCVVRPYYPPREGDQRWRQALGHFRAARKSGEPLHLIVAGTIRYSRWCDAKRLTLTDKVKQAATFFGREQCWREPWAAANGASSSRGGFLA